VKRRLTLPVGVVWLAAVVCAWLVTMPFLALLIRVTVHRMSAGGLAGMAALSATFACVVVGGSATAVALRVRRNHCQRRAALSGVATGGVVLLFFYSYAEATGVHVAGAWKALLPLVIVTTAELAMALRLRRHCREEQPPGQAPPGQAPPEQAPPDQPKTAA
jgi:hypothetical protein